MHQYNLIDSGHERKIERFGPYRIIRPCPQAIWNPAFPEKWENHQAEFIRKPKNQWKKKRLPHSWNILFNNLEFKLEPTDFGHLGLFPEHATQWDWVGKRSGKIDKPILNLFAHSGAASLSIAKRGVKVYHLDASKKAVLWAKENAALNQIDSISWIVEDAIKFLKRKVRNKTSYQGVILDPPSFGRGNQGQVFKIERDLVLLLGLCSQVVSPKGFVVMTTHTPGLTPTILRHLLLQTQKRGSIEAEEMLIPSNSFALPSGSYARWDGE